MQKKKLALNTVTSLMYQVVAIICGFVLPRFTLNYYGSTVNGIVSSINQFLHIITFLELGMGAVVQSSLYKPLFENDQHQISRIWVSANSFFRKIAIILFFYIIVLFAFYPFVVNSAYDFWFIATLIIAISISLFAQYYFGIVNQLLLIADQRGYIHYTLQIGTYILNILASIVLIRNGASIQVVKLTTSLIFFIRPVVLYLYVQKNYKLIKRIQLTSEPIKQKWNGVAQHVSSVVIDGTDTIVLTLLSTLENVSIYAVYHLVIYGVKTLFMAMTNGIQALLGEIVAKGDQDQIKKYYMWVEWVIHTTVVFVFGCTAVLVVPFISVYTAGITDVDYIVPVFAILITIAHGFHCIRLPYNMMIKAFGKYKETQSNYIFTALVNVIVSIVMVSSLGLIGVAIGTLVSMVFQTIWMAWFNSKFLVREVFPQFLKQIIVDILSVLISTILCQLFTLRSVTYLSWLLLAIEVAAVWGIITLFLNIIFYSRMMKSVLSSVMNR